MLESNNIILLPVGIDRKTGERLWSVFTEYHRLPIGAIFSATENVYIGHPYFFAPQFDPCFYSDWEAIANELADLFVRNVIHNLPITDC